MTSLTGPDLLASWLWRSITDPGVPGSIPGRGTRREYFLYRSISPPTTDRNVEQNEMMCHVQKWQLCFSYFWHCLPLLAHLSYAQDEL